MAASINRLASAAICVEETYNKKGEDQKIKDDISSAKIRFTRQSFQIGGISDLCSKISAQEQVPPVYKKLLIEENAASNSGVFTFPHQRYRKCTHERELNQNRQASLKENLPAQYKSTGKPKLIELHQFSASDDGQGSELPNGVSALQILNRVTEAQPVLHGQSKYRVYFEKIFYSQVSQSILKDVFLWLFRDGWNPDRNIQEMLFDRLACNYVQLITLADHPNYADPFLKSYPCLLSQSTYAAFCEAFSDSYSNFDENFKEKLVNLVYQWITGLKPMARTWSKWNMDDLEPVEIRNRREILQSSSLPLDGKSSNGSEQDFRLTTVSDELNSVFNEPRKSTGKATNTSRVLSKRTKKESHPVGRGPDFVPTSFRLNGQGPLVAHFLHKMNLEMKAGTEMVVQRTEMENLPPVDALTYADVIHDTVSSMHASEKSYREFYNQSLKENREFNSAKRKEFKKLKEKETLLLGKPNVVKNLSDMIVLELMMDKDSLSKATKEAIEKVLNAVE